MVHQLLRQALVCTIFSNWQRQRAQLFTIVGKFSGGTDYVCFLKLIFQAKIGYLTFISFELSLATRVLRHLMHDLGHFSRQGNHVILRYDR